jgi:hypothetical protein
MRVILQSSFARMSVIALAALMFLPAAASAAPAVGAEVEGVITSVDLSGSPRQMLVRTGAGETVPVRIHQSTRVVFHTSAPGVAPEIGSLQPGMNVRVKFPGDKPAERVHVTGIPSDALARAQAQGGSAAPAPAPAFGDTSGRELKVRVLAVDEGRGQLKADVAGQPRAFRVDNPRLLDRIDKGDLVILTLARSGSDEVTDVRSASLFGRVTSVSGRTVRVMVDGREETFTVDEDRAGNIRVGDQIQFETEERPNGERVITNVERD